MTREEFMESFRDDEVLGKLTPDDRIEIFRHVMPGSSDFTVELINEILSDYDVEGIVAIHTSKKNS